jgi:hypothetical protein
MDFIERIFGFSPDGGNGATEAVLVVSLIAAVVAAFSVIRLRFGAGRKDTRS